MSGRGGGEVVATGVGAVTPHGIGADALWRGVLAARAATEVDVPAAPTGVVSRVAPFDPLDHLPRKLVGQTDRAVQFALVAAGEALRHAGITDGTGAVTAAQATRVAVVMATGVGPVISLLDEHDRSDGGRSRVRPYLAVTMPVNMAAGRIAEHHGLHGPALVVASACAAGTDAIGVARDLILAGRADIAIAGGAEAPIAPLTVAAFRAAGALSTRVEAPEAASRPFAADRDGFVLGEGAGVLVLESAASARRRGAAALGSVVGYAATTDAFHPTRPAPDGIHAAAAVHAALADARIAAPGIGHVNAHATSTRHNDATEAAILRAALGGHCGQIPVTATKSTIGHLFGAAGAVEAIVALRAAADRTVPPIAALGTVDPACAHLDLVTGAPRMITNGVALSTSFGFGGHNAALVLRAP